MSGERKAMHDTTRNSDTHLHGMELSIWRFTFCQFNRRDTQTPDVGFVVVAALLDNLW